MIIFLFLFSNGPGPLKQRKTTADNCHTHQEDTCAVPQTNILICLEHSQDSFPLGPLTPLSESPPAKLLEATELDTSQQLWEKKMKDEECRAECSMGSSSGAFLIMWV